MYASRFYISTQTTNWILYFIWKLQQEILIPFQAKEKKEIVIVGNKMLGDRGLRGGL